MTSVCLLITIFFHQNITIPKDSVCLGWENATINDVKCQLEQNHLLSGNAYKELLAVLGDSEIKRSRIELRCDLLNKIEESNSLFNCFSYDDSTTICLERNSINDLFYADNEKDGRMTIGRCTTVMGLKCQRIK